MQLPTNRIKEIRSFLFWSVFSFRSGFVRSLCVALQVKKVVNLRNLCRVFLLEQNLEWFEWNRRVWMELEWIWIWIWIWTGESGVPGSSPDDDQSRRWANYRHLNFFTSRKVIPLAAPVIGISWFRATMGMPLHQPTYSQALPTWESNSTPLARWERERWEFWCLWAGLQARIEVW